MARRPTDHAAPGESVQGAPAEPLGGTAERRGEVDGIDEQGLRILGRVVLDAWGAPDVARVEGLALSTVKRRLRGYATRGLLLPLEEDAQRVANLHRITRGGLPCSNLPTLWGRGPRWLEVGDLAEAALAGRLAARVGSHEARTVKVHRVVMTAAIERGPRHRLDLLVAQPWGRAGSGQVIHTRRVVLEGLTWSLRLWQSMTRGWSTATLTLAPESALWARVDRLGAFSAELYAAALRATGTLSKAHGCRLVPMGAEEFLERCHASLPVEADLEAFLAALPEGLRTWRLVDGRTVWTDASDGPSDLEAHLPDAEALLPLERAMAHAMHNPDALNDLVLSLDAVAEQVDQQRRTLDAILRHLEQGDQ